MEAISSTSSNSDTDTSNNESSNIVEKLSEFQDLSTFQYRGKKHFITPKLAIALDRCKINDSMEVFDITVRNFTINRMSINRIPPGFT